MLALANLFWAGNIVLGRAVAGLVPPITLAYWRWTGAFALAICFAWPQLRRDWPVLRRSWRVVALLSATGIASFNTMSYIGLQYTTALNALLLQSTMPILILLWAFALFDERPTLWQGIGVVVSIFGVIAIAGHGSLDAVVHLSLNVGDVWVVAGVVVYAIFPPLLRKRPAVHPLSFLVVAMGLGSLMMLPFYLWEVGSGATIRGGWPSWATMAYTAVLPSFVAYLFFNRAVELMGAGRAGQSAHLMPVFGAALAVVFLGERFRLYHAVGIVLIAIGILLASLNTKPAAQLDP